MTTMEPIQLPQKLYFRIGEVARLLEIKPHVIRFWEKEFKSLRPKKTGTGQRIFSRKDVERLAAIRHLLYIERYTIDGARKHLRDKGLEPMEQNATEAVPRTDVLRDALRNTRSKLVALLATIDARRANG